MIERNEPFTGEISLDEIQAMDKSDKKQQVKAKKPAVKKAVKPDPVQKDGTTMTGMPADRVVINPDTPPLSEAKESTAVMAFGRMNPPTVGHEKLIHKVESVAKDNGGQAHIVASHSEGTQKDPLPQKTKVGYLQKIAHKDTKVMGSSKQEPTILHAAAKLHAQGHQHLVVVAGSDRVAEYHNLLHKYNNVASKHGHYNFKSIKVVSAGHRDPDSEGVSGMSGTKMREHARAGNKEEFKSGLPKALHSHAEEMIQHISSIKEDVSEGIVRGVMRAAAANVKGRIKRTLRNVSGVSQIKAGYSKSPINKAIQSVKSVKATIKKYEKLGEESVDEALTMQQRLHRGVTMRRNAKKLANARRIAQKRLARQSQMRRRALKRARSVVRQRIAGQRGLNYKNLSTGDKIAIDRLADKRKKQIVRIANRLAPRVKRDEIQRLAAIVQGKRVRNTPTPIFSSYEMDMNKTLTEKAELALRNKAEKAGVSFGAVIEVYARGIQTYPENTSLTPQQYAFSRVNSFLANGKAAKEDTDIIERKTVMYTARDMANVDVEDLPKMHTFKQHQRLKADIQQYEKDNQAQAARKKADVIRRVAGEVARKVIESSDPTSIYSRVARKITRVQSPQMADLKNKIVSSLKKKDYEMLASIILYLSKEKLGGGRRVQQENVCVPEEDYIYEEMSWDVWEAKCNDINEEFLEGLNEEEGKKLNKPFRTPGGPKKFAVYVKNDKGNVVKLGFGDPNLEIKRDDPDRRKAYRARHGCDNPGPKWKANYWSCNWSWSANKKVGA